MDDPRNAEPSPSDAMAQAAMAEAELRRLGMDGVRVLPRGDHAILRIPGPYGVVPWTGLLRGEILRAVRSAGFLHVSVDLDPSAGD